MKPINLGNGTSDIQWENANELRSYPFENFLEQGFVPDSHGAYLGLRASKTYLDEELFGVVSDLSIFVEYDQVINAGDLPVFKLSSMHVGPGLVSISVSNGEFVLTCSVPRSELEPYRPYPMVPVGNENCSGMCSFGDLPAGMLVSKRWDDGPRVLRTLVRILNEKNIQAFVDPISGEEVTGHVDFKLPGGVTADVKTSQEIGAGNLDISYVYLTPDSRYDEMLASPCDIEDPSHAGVLPVLYSLNGVEPNEYGEVAVVLE